MTRDEDFIIPPGECALVSSDDCTELSMVVPDPPETPVPDLLLFLTEIMARWDGDPEFVSEMIQAFKNRPRN